MFQNGVWQGEMEKLCSQSYIGHSKCEHNTILCQHPGTGTQSPSVDSPLVILTEDTLLWDLKEGYGSLDGEDVSSVDGLDILVLINSLILINSFN